MTASDTKVRAEFASKLRKARTRNQWQAADVAKWCGITPTLLSHYENGRRTPGIANLRRLCIGLRASADWLLDIEGSE